MPNIASVLKSEIARIARKEIRIHTDSTAKLARAHRSEIAALKKRVADLERALKRAERQRPESPAVAANDESPGAGFRFSAKGLASHRARLELSAAELGKLVGASGQSVYNWEAGKSRPRAMHLAALAAVRSIGKREARARLEAA